jgi:hypothetical protein
LARSFQNVSGRNLFKSLSHRSSLRPEHVSSAISVMEIY